MESSESFASAIKSEKLRAVYSTWSQLANGRIGPRRAELTPAQLRRSTSWTFFVDILPGAEDFRFGFAGDMLMQFLGSACEAPTLAGMTGMHFFAVAEALFRQCAATQKPLVSGPRPTHYRGREYLERQVLLLPLSDDGMNVTGLLGAFETWQLGTHAHIFEPVLAA